MSDTQAAPTTPAGVAPTTSTATTQADGTKVTVKSVEPGWTTTEFWQSMVVTLTGLGLLVFGVVKEKEIAIQWGASLAGVSSVGYAALRSLIKK